MVDALDPQHLATAQPWEVRQACRDGDWTGTTASLASGYVQANLVVLPHEAAYEFLRFCLLNPRPCPVLDVTDTGSPVPRLVAPTADLRTDLPRYRVYRDGQLVDEPLSIEPYWSNDLVGIVLGCSFTFEHMLSRKGISLRHWECNTNVAMYRTNRDCVPCGPLHGPLVVSMRPIPAAQVALAVEISSRFPSSHGAPLHIGSPEALGIRDLNAPDWGVAQAFQPSDIPVFWACGVTPQAIAIEARLPLMITHSPGHMFITDLTIESVER